MAALEPNVHSLVLPVPGQGSVSALLWTGAAPSACFVFAHGAGAGMAHPFMQALARELVLLGVATLRFQFPSMEAGRKRPDVPAAAQDTVRAAVACAGLQLPGVPLFAGGKSFGGRMTSQAQAEHPLPGVRGLAFVGFPLHAAGKPAVVRAEHLKAVHCPMLFLQGSRDALADLTLLRPVVAGLDGRATLNVIDDADHGFHVRVRSGRTDAQVICSLAERLRDWFHGVVGS